MAEVRFYHLQRSALDTALPALLEKAYERGMRSVVMAGSSDRVEALNEVLWTYRKDRFLPHGSTRDGHADQQPIWLTNRLENPNKATVLVLVDGAEADSIDLFEVVCLMFDGGDSDAVARARQEWRRYRDAGHACTYWQQTGRGGWEKKA